MFQRNISTDNIKDLIEKGEIIEEYPEDEHAPLRSHLNKNPYLSM